MTVSVDFNEDKFIEWYESHSKPEKTVCYAWIKENSTVTYI